MKNVRMWIFALAFAAVSSMSFCAEYYVSPDGKTANAGTRNAPWPLAFANGKLQAGDTAILLDGAYTNMFIAPARSGKDGQMISYRAENKHKAVFSDSEPSSPTLTSIQLNERSYITVDGIKSIDVKRWARGDRSHHLTIANCHFENGRGWSNCRFDENDGGMRVTNNYFNEGSDLLSIDGGDGHLVEGNFFGDASHSGLVFLGVQRSVARNNTMTNRRWRCMEVESQRHEPYRKSMYNLIEGNTFGFTPVLGIQFAGNYSILRRNVFRHNMTGMAWSNYLGSAKTPEAWHCESNRFYNNVIAECGANEIVLNLIAQADALGIKVEEYTPVTGYAMSFSTNLFNPRNQDYLDSAYGDNISVNNIFYKNRNAEEVTDKFGKTASLTSQIGFYWNATPEFGRFHYNVFCSGSVGDDAFYFGDAAYGDSPEQRNRPVDSFQDRYPEWATHNVDIDPMFVDPDNGDFRLKKESPLIDTGGPLTTAVSAGNGTSIQVVDALYFFDGAGILDADMILIGGKQMRISSIDYDTNTISLTSEVTWDKGAPVSMDYAGDAPDPGVTENESIQPP